MLTVCWVYRYGVRFRTVTVEGVYIVSAPTGRCVRLRTRFRKPNLRRICAYAKSGNKAHRNLKINNILYYM